MGGLFEDSYLFIRVTLTGTQRVVYLDTHGWIVWRLNRFTAAMSFAHPELGLFECVTIDRLQGHQTMGWTFRYLEQSLKREKARAGMPGPSQIIFDS